MPVWLVTLPFILASSQAAAPEVVRLPPPRVKGTVSLEEALARRESVRGLRGAALSWDEIGQLLWAAQGITHGGGLRTAPSAGALYPLELYVSVAEGVYHYEPRRHQVTRVLAKDVRRDLRRAALDQESLEAPCVFAIAAVLERTSARYGERSSRYVHLEAGHAAQNLLLQVTASGLAAVPVGAFDDRRAQEALALPAGRRLVYLIPVGRR